MKKLTNSLTVFLILIFLFSCKSDKKEATEKEPSSDQTETTKTNKRFVDVTTKSMEFMSVDTIRSGWNTFKYHNLSNETHFLLVEKYPPGKTIDTLETVVVPVFTKGMDLINAGKMEEGFAAFGALPEWFSEIQFLGGTGLIAPKQTATSTIKLSPGYYILECYVKMPNGKFHSSMGMAKAIIVNDDDSGNTPPSANVHITISSTEGITFNEEIKKGENTFSVYFKDQIVHENFVGHDVNLVKLDANANIDALEIWMNWADPKGLITPVPNGVVFLGGVNDSPKGSTGYFTVHLSPGNYAFISEVPNALKKGMLKTFTISE
ncbi:hypothetical protein [Snuella sedimenti]|uniref:DUF4382 domain-containing protein n=1 Tax=Snuella sedimenti TaxID=2798802 RepID=A0A8J7IYK9_9FLAO|nr:hypothetical protein [Snuella sedimenti]MBJ6369775.1 hypothetical protein [Snuella sedimenti]